jgi:anoctamin-8
MGFIAVIVNCGLIGLSGPVHRIFPNITGAQTVILIIVLEHLMLLVKLGISAAVPSVPHHVAVARARTEHRRQQLEREAGPGGQTSSPESERERTEAAVQTEPEPGDR